MKTQSLNLCPTCLYKSSCVLTSLKDDVWSCSEYDEDTNDHLSFSATKIVKKESQPELVLA